MGKKVLAWVLLIGFILLLTNIIFIGYYRMGSLAIYSVIIVIFLFINRKTRKS
jgi:hypothetical protein